MLKKYKTWTINNSLLTIKSSLFLYNMIVSFIAVHIKYIYWLQKTQLRITILLIQHNISTNKPHCIIIQLGLHLTVRLYKCTTNISVYIVKKHCPFVVLYGLKDISKLIIY